MVFVKNEFLILKITRIYMLGAGAVFFKDNDK